MAAVPSTVVSFVKRGRRAALVEMANVYCGVLGCDESVPVCLLDPALDDK
jgi:hypothetical protein